MRTRWRRLLFVAFSAWLTACGEPPTMQCDAGTYCPSHIPDHDFSCAPAFEGRTCAYATQRCACEHGRWWCEDPACPTSAPTTGAPCTTAGIACHPRSDGDCRCVAPEMTWYCCNHDPICPSEPIARALCCRPIDGSPCDRLTDAGLVHASCDDHWHVEVIPVASGP